MKSLIRVSSSIDYGLIKVSSWIDLRSFGAYSLIDQKLIMAYSSIDQILITNFFCKQTHFPVEPRVAIGNAKNEAGSCYEVANVF